MQKEQFKNWLEGKYLQRNGRSLASGTQVSRIANCSTIEQIEGDLDEHFRRDGMKHILDKLTFSTASEGVGEQPKHRIPIHGDLVNGTMTYRSAANLYRKFRIAQNCVVPDSQDDLAHELQYPTETERRLLVKTRVGQQRFRYLVLERWDYRCAVTNGGLLLTASHIKPWKVSNHGERLDPYNGLCLSPIYDRAFDAGIITFTPDGNMLLSSQIPRREASLLGLTHDVRVEGLSPRHQVYLQYHREVVWQTS